MSSIRTSKDVRDIIELNRRHAYARAGVCIFELGSMDDLMPFDTAEEIRKLFVKNKTPVRQLTNHRHLDAWTSVEALPKTLQQIRTIDKAVFDIKHEIVIFDDTVAMYRIAPDVSYSEINNKDYADMMRDLFNGIWNIAEVMVLGAGGSAHTKQYMPITSEFMGIPMVLYPAKDDGDITQAFDRKDVGCIERYVKHALEANLERLTDADMLICYAWNDGSVPMVDPWKVKRNKLSDDSGFLYDAFTLKDTAVVTDMGISSGNSLIVFTAEEMLLRDLVIDQKLSFKEAANRAKYMPKFPAGFLPCELFYVSESDIVRS